MKKLLSIIICFAIFMCIFSLKNVSANEADEITSQIYSTYDSALRLYQREEDGGSSFDGYCGKYVRFQLRTLGLISKLDTDVRGNGNTMYGNTKSGTTSTGYIKNKYGGNNCLYDIINSYPGQSVYNIFVSWTYQYGASASNPGAGHVTFIHAIINNVVYYSEGYATSGVAEGTPLISSLSSFYSKYNKSYGNAIGAVHFVSKTYVSNPWIKASKSGLFLGESVTFDFGANNATSYKITIKHLDEIIKTEDDVKSGVSYTFEQEGTYYAYITAKNGDTTVDSQMVSFYIVDALDMGDYFITKIRNPVSGYYVALDTSTSNVYLASETANGNNEWKFIKQEDLSYKIVNVKTGGCLGVTDLSVENGANIGCSPDDNTDFQRWYIRRNLSGYALVSKAKLASDLSITGNGWIYGDCIFDGANISLYENDSVQSQRFELAEYRSLYGDANGDGEVNTTDLAVMKLFLAGASELTDIGALAGDLNGDGQVSTTDLAQLKLHLAGV